MLRLRDPSTYAFVLLVLWACNGSLSSGQDLASGAVEGWVEAASHVTVTLRDIETGTAISTQTASDGTFMLSGLAPGSYLIRVASAGSSQTIIVRSAATTRVQLRVVGSVVAVFTSPTNEGSTHLLTELNEDDEGLPSGRGLQSEQAGAVIDGVSSEQKLGSVPAGTGRGTNDPDDNPDSAEVSTGPSHGLGRGRHSGISYLYAEGSVREFRVGVGGYSAQVGSAGGVLAAVTRRGGETSHGSAFLHVGSDVLAARDPLAIATSYNSGLITTESVKPHDLRANFGMTVGGPVQWLPGVRYFVAAEGQRRDYPAISSPSNPLFYQLTSMQKAVLGTRGVTSLATSSALTYLSSLTGKTDRRADEDLEFGRLDWQATTRLEAGLQYNRARWNAPAGLMESPVVARGRASLGSSAGSVDQAIARASASLRNGFAEEIQAGFTRDLQYEKPQPPLPQEAAIAPGGLVPEVNIGPDGLIFGTPAGLSQVAYPDEQRLEVRDALTLQRGHHLVQAGASYERVHDSVATLSNAAGTFRYDSGATAGKAGGLVDFITDYTFNVNAYPNGGCPSIESAYHLFCFRSFSQSFGQTRVDFSTGEWASFVEDTWRPTRQITFHAGLRYEYAALPHPTQPNPKLDAIFGSTGATGLLPADRNNLAPRFAVAVEPFGHGHGVLKLGYGVFFGRMPGATIASALTNTGLPSATTNVRIRPSTETVCPQAPANGFGYPCSFASVPDEVVAATRSAVVLDRRFRLPVVQQGSITMEREFGRRTTLALEAVINEDRQLPGSRDINIVPSTSMERFQLVGGTGGAGVRNGEVFLVPRYSARVSPQFGPVTDVVSNVNATYDGLVVRLTTRPVADVQISCHYTWSKAIDFGQAGSATPRTNGQFDPFTNGYDKGLSSLNYPHALYAAGVWAPSLEAGRTLRTLVNGWTLSAVTVARSGRPYSMDISGGPYLRGGHESINGSGGALYLPTIGRNTLRLPPVIKTDLRMERAFRLKRGLQGQASIEASNVFNHQSVSSVNQRAYLAGAETEGITPLVFQNAATIQSEGLNSTPFGTAIGTGSSLSRERQVQLSLKASF